MYSKEVREFASTLFFKSPSAYHYVRKFLQLPGVSTIGSWLSNHGCYPGFTNEAFTELESRINSCDIDDCDKYRYCTIMIDEMSMKKNVQWDRVAGRFVGYVDMGFDEDSTEEASKALVVLAVGLIGRWKIPLGYFFSNGLRAVTVANIVRETLTRLHNISVIGVAVTFDGAQNQICSIELLGASFSPHRPRPYFLILQTLH